jgi:hypothetical protein
VRGGAQGDTARITSTDSGGAGHSAQREYERRRQGRHARLRSRYGAVGAVIAALVGEPREITVWRQGAEGEVTAAHRLTAHLRRSEVALLHDRRLPGRGRANIDHLAIGPGGLTVIDTKSSRGAVRLTTVGFVHPRDVLLVGRWDRTRDLDAVERQIDAITARLSRIGVDTGDILGALCFPYMRRPWLHHNHARDGRVIVDDPRHIAKLARRAGPLTRDDVAALTTAVSEAFPPAIR